MPYLSHHHHHVIKVGDTATTYIHVMYLPPTHEKVCLGKSLRMCLSDNSNSENCLRRSWNTTLLFKPISIPLFFSILSSSSSSSSSHPLILSLYIYLPHLYLTDKTASSINQSIMNPKANHHHHNHSNHYNSQKEEEEEKEKGEKNLFTGPGEQTIFYPPLAPIQTRRNKFFRTRRLQMRMMTLDEWWEEQEERFFAAAECDEGFGGG